MPRLVIQITFLQCVSERFLKAQLQHSILSNDAGADSAPHITPVDGHTLLEAFSDLARTLTGDPSVCDTPTQEQLRRVLKLVTVLWGPLRGDVDPGMTCMWKCIFIAITSSYICIDPSSYDNQMARRRAVYHWLRETNEPVTDEEVSSCSEKDYLKALFSLVSGQQLSKACRLAQKHHDHKLALLLSQATQNTTYNR